MKWACKSGSLLPTCASRPTHHFFLLPSSSSFLLSTAISFHSQDWNTQTMMMHRLVSSSRAQKEQSLRVVSTGTNLSTVQFYSRLFSSLGRVLHPTDSSVRCWYRLVNNNIQESRDDEWWNEIQRDHMLLRESAVVRRCMATHKRSRRQGQRL